MATTYTTPEKVASLLQIDKFPTGTGVSGRNSYPNTEEVERFINWAEDEIDRRTNHAWREVQVTETHDAEILREPSFPSPMYYRMTRPYFTWTCIVHLQHRNIRQLSSANGDKLEIWDGSQWKDLLTTGTEARDGDFWVDYTNGTIYLKELPAHRRASVRVTYRYGETSVPKDIEEAATLLAAIFLLESEDYTMLLPEGTDKYPLQAKAEVWKKRVEQILESRREILYI
ncbi:hypothetical protein [Candidatus Pyrohabitans sp.]